MRALVSTLVHRPRQEVFDFVADPENLVRWTGTNEVRLLDERPLRMGTRFATVSTYRGGPEDHVYRITAWQPPTSTTVEGTWGSGWWSAPVTATLRFEPEGDDTLVSYDVTLTPRSRGLRLVEAMLGWFFARVIRRQQRQELSIAKRLLEGPTGPHEPARSID